MKEEAASLLVDVVAEFQAGVSVLEIGITEVSPKRSSRLTSGTDGRSRESARSSVWRAGWERAWTSCSRNSVTPWNVWISYVAATSVSPVS